MKNKAKKFGRRYPWKKWFQLTEPFTLLKGKHFSCEPYSMAQMARNIASRYRVGISITVGTRSITCCIDRRRFLQETQA